MVKVKFVNKSGERVFLYQQGGGILRVLESGQKWNRPPEEGTLSTVMVDEVHGQKFPAPRPRPFWIDKTEWVWEECGEGEIYAPYRTITFLDNNVVKLKRRPFWKLPEMKWPCVEFCFQSHKMKMFKTEDAANVPVILYNGIPHRKTVSPVSKYAPYKKWIFDEVMELRDSNPPYKQMVESYENTEHGEDKRATDELAKIEELKKEAEERRKLALI